MDCSVVDNFNDVYYLLFLLYVGVFIEFDDSYSFEVFFSFFFNIEFLIWLSSGVCEVDFFIFIEINGSFLFLVSSMNFISLSCRDVVWRKSLI